MSSYDDDDCKISESIVSADIQLTFFLFGSMKSIIDRYSEAKCETSSEINPALEIKVLGAFSLLHSFTIMFQILTPLKLILSSYWK